MRERTKVFLIFALVLILIRGCIAVDLYSEPIHYGANNGSISFNRLTGTVTEYNDLYRSYPSIEIIPEEISGVNVTTIGKEAFSESYVSDITIPDTVKSIVQNAFYQCPANIYFCGSQEQWERVRKGNADFSNTVIHYDTIMYPTNDGNIVFDPQTGTIIGCDDDTTAVDIPTSINGIPVVAIGENAFYECDNLTSVTIPDSITIIGACAFSGCESLSDITIPDSVTLIGHGAFSGCESLTSITIPGSVRTIGDYAFSPETRYYDASNDVFHSKFNLIDRSSLTSNLTNVTILDGVITIGAHAFSDCYNLTNITIPDSVTSIGDRAFYGCSSLTNITLPDSVTAIGDFVFYDCSSLANITISDNATSIGDHAFDGCSSLTNITISDNLISIGEYAFDECSSLANITISDNVTSIGDHVFDGCSSLTSITIPYGVTEIGDYAFSNCSNLTSITIPDSVTAIRSDAFEGCDSLIHIYYSGSYEQWKRIGKSSNDFSNATIHFNDTMYPTFGGNIYFNPQTGTVTGYFGELTDVTIPAEINGVPVVAISDCAFSNCRTLTSITIPDSVTTIGNSAFAHCDNLTSITIPDGIISIGVQTFYACSSLTSITIPDSITTIDWNAFSYCSSLADIYYGGAEEQWAQINMVNNNFSGAFIHYNTEA